MSADNPWKGLGRSDVGRLSAQRADPSHPHDFFWARNTAGNYAFVLSLKDDPGDLRPAPELRGIAVNLYRDSRQLQLVLSDSSDWQMFAVLCRDLLDYCRSTTTTQEVMDALMARLASWQRLLALASRRILDEREIRGLVGELLFLRDQLIIRAGPRAVLAWQGPHGKPQDFAVGLNLFEVKTVRPGDSPKIHIASPDQLWSGGLPLHLCVIPLADCEPGAAGAVTLALLISELREALRRSEYSEVFEELLAAVGYSPLNEYAEYAFQVGGISWYAVVEGFPMIDPASVSEGIADVRYAINLASCERFRAEPDWRVVMGGEL